MNWRRIKWRQTWKLLILFPVLPIALLIAVFRVIGTTGVLIDDGARWVDDKLARQLSHLMKDTSLNETEKKS